MCTDGVWGELHNKEILATLRAYPLERALKQMLDHAEFRGGQYADNLSAVAMRYGEDIQPEDDLLPGDDLGLDGFTTRLKEIGYQEAVDAVTTDKELDRVLSEIQSALKRRK
jgi:serine/threonine protein phosphatase PrpC